MANRWLKFLKEFKSRHKGMSLRDAMKAASKEYKKGGKLDDKVEKPKRRRKKKSSK